MVLSSVVVYGGTQAYRHGGLFSRPDRRRAA
jgi:hypothetical protein